MALFLEKAVANASGARSFPHRNISQPDLDSSGPDVGLIQSDVL